MPKRKLARGSTTTSAERGALAKFVKKEPAEVPAPADTNTDAVPDAAGTAGTVAVEESPGAIVAEGSSGSDKPDSSDGDDSVAAAAEADELAEADEPDKADESDEPVDDDDGENGEDPLLHGLTVNVIFYKRFPGKTMELRSVNMRKLKPGDWLYIVESGGQVTLKTDVCWRVAYKARFLGNVPLRNPTEFEHWQKEHCVTEAELRAIQGDDFKWGTKQVIGWRFSEVVPVTPQMAYLRKKHERNNITFRWRDLCPYPYQENAEPAQPLSDPVVTTEEKADVEEAVAEIEDRRMIRTLDLVIEEANAVVGAGADAAGADAAPYKPYVWPSVGCDELPAQKVKACFSALESGAVSYPAMREIRSLRDGYAWMDDAFAALLDIFPPAILRNFKNRLDKRTIVHTFAGTNCTGTARRQLCIALSRILGESAPETSRQLLATIEWDALCQKELMNHPEKPGCRFLDVEDFLGARDQEAHRPCTARRRSHHIGSLGACHQVAPWCKAHRILCRA